MGVDLIKKNSILVMDFNYKFKVRYIYVYICILVFFFFIDLKDIENKLVEFIDSNIWR